MPTRIDIQHWESTVNLTNANLTDINWEETYPIYEFIQDPQKRAEVKNAVDQYIAGQQIKVLELRPMYRMHSKRQKILFMYLRNLMLIIFLKNGEMNRTVLMDISV